ncbi:Amidase [Niveomyces insectorum RCEF 264]|uniref:Amidase n=1 Tax=Niveomyces insectorum RCEF 264 TaxID=1081102 RepID=A0A168AC34_9HYPO|nr:Amidase [Niveomyces insectorum RCEF 264]
MGDDPVVTREKLHELAQSNGFQIAPRHEAAYLLGLRSSYAIAKQIDALPDYIDPRLDVVPTVGGGPRKYKQPNPAKNPLTAWCHEFDLKAAEPETDMLRGRSVVVKDTIAVGQIPQALGTLPQFLSERGRTEGYPVSPIDATVVRRLLLAGGRLKGTTTCENFSLSPMSFSSVFGPVHNPWQRGFNSGGSSSGSAALVGLSVARKMGEPGLDDLGADVDLALGGDQAGSIRVPAAYCGIYGLKPTFGLVPYTGIAGLLPMTDYVGPLATNLEDIALCLSVIAGYDGLDPRMGPESPLRKNVPKYHDELAAFAAAVVLDSPGGSNARRLRIGLISESFQIPGMNPEAAERVRSAATTHFAAVGAEVADVSVPLHALGAAIWTAAVRNQMASHAFGGRATDVLAHDLPHIAPPSWPPKPPNDSQEFYDVLSRHNPAVVLTTLGETLLGELLPPLAQRKAHRHVLQLRAAYDAALEEFDVLVTPTVPTVAPPLPDMTDDEVQNDPATPSAVERMMRLVAGSINNTAPFNASGHPAISVPCGWATSTRGDCKLPVGMQIIGRRFDDLGVLKAAKLFELGGGGLGPRTEK